MFFVVEADEPVEAEILLAGFEGAVEVEEAIDGLPAGTGVVIRSFSFAGSAFVRETSEEFEPFPDNRLERFWRGPGLGDASLAKPSGLEPIRAVSESVGLPFSFISGEMIVVEVEGGMKVEAGIVDVDGDVDEIGGPKKVTLTGDIGVAGVRRTSGKVDDGDDVIVDEGG